MGYVYQCSKKEPVGFLMGNGPWCDVGIVNPAIEREMSFKNEPTEITHLVRLLTNLGFEVLDSRGKPIFRIGSPIDDGTTYKIIQKRI